MMKVQTSTWLKLVFVTAPMILLTGYVVGSEYFVDLMPPLVRWKGLIILIVSFAITKLTIGKELGIILDEVGKKSRQEKDNDKLK
jgi:hypothetical protein